MRVITAAAIQHYNYFHSHFIPDLTIDKHLIILCLFLTTHNHNYNQHTSPILINIDKITKKSKKPTKQPAKTTFPISFIIVPEVLGPDSEPTTLK